MRSSRVAAACALVWSLALPCAAADVTGEFKAGVRPPIRPKYAVAFDDRDQRDARKHVIAVLLSDAPVDIAAAVAELDPHTHLINQDALRGRNYVLLWVRPDGDVSMNATYSEKMVQFIDMTTQSLKADMSANTADKVAGRIYTAKPVKTMDGETYSVNITFSAVVTRAPAATALAADGGEPAKAFGALLSAVAKKNWDGIARNVTEKNLKMFNDTDRTPKENLAGAIETLGFWLPKKVLKITGGQLRGESAVLEVEGEIFAAQKALFLVRMVKSGTRWVFDRATNAGLID
jgi:hypothetical protein